MKSMLLVIDVGNTNTVLGVYQGQQLLHDWRLTTDKSRTVDEYAMLSHELFGLSGLHFTDIDDVII
jgi:type III pantothenate kinase